MIKDYIERITKKYFFDYLKILLLVPCIGMLLLCMVALIPRDVIQENVEKSAEYLNIHNDHFKHSLIKDYRSTSVDEIADANLINIAFYYDGRHPLVSSIKCDWYVDGAHYNESLLNAVKYNLPPNDNYFRYWHGSLLFIRPMLAIFNIKQIYVCLYLIVFGLLMYLVVLLMRNRLKYECLSLLISMLVVNLWVVPMCFEFTWSFAISFLVSIIVVKRALSNRYETFGTLFLITGMITIYLDFFTTETITLLIPLLLTLRIRIKKQEPENVAFVMKCSLSWVVGYIFMWSSKWVIGILYFGLDGLKNVLNQMYIHLSAGDQMSYVEILSETFKNNVSYLLPIDFGVAPTIIFILIVSIVFAVINRSGRYTLRYPTSNLKLYLILGLVPYFRYALIIHHSWAHYFTYRAQAATVLALCLGAAEIVKMKPSAIYEGGYKR